MKSHEGKQDSGSGSKTPWRLLICDDQRLVRLRVREMLKETSSIQVIGEAFDGGSAVELALELKPDLVLMDVSMPTLDGIEATRQILKQLPGTKILAFSADFTFETLTKAVIAGAHGYILKPGKASELLVALETILAGKSFFSGRASDPQSGLRQTDHE